MKKFKVLSLMISIFLIVTMIPLYASASSGYIWPTTTHTLSRTFAQHGRTAIDIAVPSGTTVYASKGGTVYAAYVGCKNFSGLGKITCKSKGCTPNAGFNSNGYCNNGFGNGVIIKHDDGTFECYAHMSTINVYWGQTVAQGAVIGTSGSSGYSSGPHLHINVNRGTTPWNGTKLNPANLFSGDVVVGGKPAAPAVSVNGQNVTVSWNSVNKASSYDVYLVQSPWRWEDIKYTKHLTGTSHTFNNVVIGQYKAFVIARPNSNTVQSPWTVVNVGAQGLFKINDVSNITSNSAKVSCSYSYTGTHPSSVGLYLGTSTSNMPGRGTDVINHNKNPFDIWYNVSGLNSNTTYYYRFYAITSTGATVWSDIKSFKTAGGPICNIGTVVGTNGGYLAINDKPVASPKYSTQIGRIPPGGQVVVYPAKQSGNWYYVTYNGVSGYAFGKYIKL